MRVELSAEELQILLVSIQNIQIQGKDAPAVAKIMKKMADNFEKQVEKDNQKVDPK